LIKLGVKEVECVIVDLNEDDEMELNIRLNANTGSWDWDTLANDWEVVDLEKWGLDIPQFDTVEELEASEDDYEVPEGGIETDIVIGDLFEIGEHRLLCGDSTDSDAVARLMNGEKADMVFTDPPYDMQMKGGCVGEAAKAMIKVEKDIEFISKFDPQSFLNCLPLVFQSKKMNAYIFCNKDLVPKYLNFAVDCGYSFNILFWKKPNCVPLGDSHYPDVEYLLLFRKSATWNNGLKDVSYSRCLEYGREKGLHPTMKPIELISNEIKISSNVDSILVDFFLGSGSTMVAAHQLKRKCYGMELEPKYCAVIIDRMRKLDSSLIIKRNGKQI
jgi:DNA modification methylase